MIFSLINNFRNRFLESIDKNLAESQRTSSVMLRMFMPPLKDFELLIEDLKMHLETPNLVAPAKKVKLDQMENTFNGYKVIKHLGRGAQGCTVLARKAVPGKNGEIDFSLKVIKVAETEYAKFADFLRMEAVFLFIVNHKHIVNLFETFEHENLTCLVIQYCHEGDMLKKKGKLSEADIKDIVAMCLFALHQIHHYRMVHRDIKMENILINNE